MKDLGYDKGKEEKYLFLHSKPGVLDRKLSISMMESFEEEKMHLIYCAIQREEIQLRYNIHLCSIYNNRDIAFRKY